MKTIKIVRYGSIPGRGTFGQLSVTDDDGKLVFSCRTAEREWLDNEPYKSCIPSGLYIVELGMYYGGDGVGGNRDYPAYVVKDVPGRNLIKIHIANRPQTELLGCIAPGEEFGTLANDWAVISSAIMFERFMAVMDGDKRAKLKIDWRNIEKESVVP